MVVVTVISNVEQSIQLASNTGRIRTLARKRERLVVRFMYWCRSLLICQKRAQEFDVAIVLNDKGIMAVDGATLPHAFSLRDGEHAVMAATTSWRCNSVLTKRGMIRQ